MYNLSNEEKQIHDATYKNALIFFKDFVNRLLDEDNGHTDEIDNELLVLIVASLQISMELALKAHIIKRTGLASVLETKHMGTSKADLLEMFRNNKLKTKKFELLKVYVEKNTDTFWLIESDDIATITDFQRYRNGIVHLSFNFQEGDYFDLKYDIVYFITNILVRILSGEDDRPSEFMRNVLGQQKFNKLLSYKPYISAMEKLAKTKSDKVFSCIVCDRRTYAKETDYCYACNFDGEMAGEFIDCDSCKEKKSVMFDHLNITDNDNMMKGLCLNCSDDCIVYKCPVCEIAYNFESGIESCSNENGCVNM